MLNEIRLENIIESISYSSSFNDVEGGGKSNASFIKSHDGLFIFKRLNRNEFKMFKSYSQSYFKQNFKRYFKNKSSLLCRIYGIFEIHVNQMKHHFILMENLFCGLNNMKSLRIYDLKGSETNRYINKDKNVQKVLLDTNFKIDQNSEPFPLNENDYKFCEESFINDSKFLSKHNLIDYSLLLIINPLNYSIRLGIIDYLRLYTWDKHLEHVGKIVMNKGAIPTIVNPNDYKNRFLEAMRKYFMKININ